MLHSNIRYGLAALILLSPSLLMADSPAGVQDTFTGAGLSGMTHPILGADHFLAMFAVGLVSVFYRRLDMLLIPTAFVLVTGISGWLGYQQTGFPAIEIGIAISLLVLGGCALLNGKLPVIYVYVIVCGFALFHGYAHGSEIPDINNVTAYSTGFLIGTAGIHIMGILLGELLYQPEGRPPLLTAYALAMILGGIYFTLHSLGIF